MVDPAKITNHPEIRDAFYFEDKELFEIYKRCVPPRQAYYYFPQGEELIIPHKKPEKALRRIYYNTPLTELEENWIIEYNKIISSHPENVLPDYWNDAINLRFIYSTECDLDKAYKRMLDYLKWYRETYPLNIQPEDKTIKLLNSGFCYVHGRDHQFRPVIYCQPYILQKNEGQFTDTEVVNASIFMCQFMANNMLIPGQIENWIMFINLEGTSILSLPDSMKKLIQALSDNFLARLYKSYILGMSTFLRILFKFICNFLEEITVRKITVLDGRKDKRLFTDISPQNMEQRFGGTAPDLEYNKTNSLFPPRMPSDNFFKDDEDPNNILISEEEYKRRYKDGLIISQAVSPYILEDIKREKEEMANKLKSEKTKKQKEISEMRQHQLKKKLNFNFKMNLNTEPESFDLNKFKYNKNINHINDIKGFAFKKNNFCNNISLLTTSS